MVSLKSAILAATYAVAAAAVDITVKATGGNATSGHQYGFLHEVCTLFPATSLIHVAH